ncbi:MAG: tetratricopeptide repeat protein [Candidatus Bathyarchaeia archaeon]
MISYGKSAIIHFLEIYPFPALIYTFQLLVQFHWIEKDNYIDPFMKKPFKISIEKALSSMPIWILIPLLGMISYHNSFNNGFHFDDRTIILENERVKDIVSSVMALDRVVVYVTFALNHAIHGFDRLWAWHIVNIIIHIINAILILFLGRKIWRFNEDKRWGPPEIAALIFVVHPLMSEPVNYIKARFELMATMFCLLSILFFLKAFEKKGKKGLFNAFTGFLLALFSIFSKDIYAFFCPALIILILSATYLERGSFRKGWKQAILLSTSGLIVFVFTIILLDIFHQILERSKSPALFQYILTEQRAFWYGLSLFFLPIPGRLNVDHSFRISVSIFEIDAIFAAFATLGLVALAAFLWNRTRPMALCIYWVLIAYLPYFLLTSQEIIREYTLYLPSIGLAFITASGMIYLSRTPIKRPYIALIALLIILSFLTVERNHDWLDEISLWKDAVSKSPEKSRPHGNLSYAYLSRDELDLAIMEGKRAIELDPREWRAMLAIGRAYKKKRNLIMAGQEFKRATRTKPEAHEAWEELGLVLKEMGREEAILCLQRAVELNPNSYIYKNNLGLAYCDIGKYDLSESIFLEALRLKPGDPRILGNLGNLQSRRGLHREALGYYQEALKREPSNAELLNGIAMSHYFLGEYDRAVEYLKMIVDRNPADQRAFVNLGTTLLKMGKFEDAIEAYQRALNLDPKNEKLHLIIADIYLEKMRDSNKGAIYINRLKGINPSSTGLKGL